jgi:hypothetical protein
MSLNLTFDAISARPEQAALIGRSLAVWSIIEAEMAVLLGVLLKSDTEAAIAVYLTIRRSTARIDAINAACRATLNPRDIELIDAILIEHQSCEAERNALAHGYFGWANELPDAVLWIDNTRASHLMVEFVLSTERCAFRRIGTSQEKIYKNTFYYTSKDLTLIIRQFIRLGIIIRDVMIYLRDQLRDPSISQQEKYDQLCSEVPIRRALRALRERAQKNTR